MRKASLTLTCTTFAAMAVGACTLTFADDWKLCERDEHCDEGQLCGEDNTCVEAEVGGCVVAIGENITEDQTWEPGDEGCTYLLEDVIYIEPGVTLSIRPGTQIRGEFGSALVSTSGARLDARGTEFEPIVLSSAQPEGMRLSGDWGGLALLGRATVNEPNPVLEGLEDVQRASFGGTDDSWNCGALEYVRVEFAGFPLETDEELNGLTLGGCGTGTIINHVQVHQGKDDGVEIFGGTVSMDHVVISQAQDDSLDWDRGWRGDAQFIAIIQDAEGDNGFECDNWSDDNDAEPRSMPRVYNATLIGSNTMGASQRGATFKEGTAGEVRNAIFMGHPVESIDLKDPATVAQVTDGAMVVSHSMFFAAGPDGTHYFPTAQEEMLEDDDEGFDEAVAFMAEALGNVFGSDPGIANPYDLRNPGWVPSAAAAGVGVKPPGDGIFDEAATYAGAFAPGTTPWTANWTAYPEN